MSRTYLFGDSIGKGVAFDENRSRYVLLPDRCANLLIRGGVDLENHARFGAAILEGYADFCAAELLPGSNLVIEFGGNDCDLDWDAVAADPEAVHEAKTPLPVFRAVLETFVRDARARGLRPVLVTPPPLVSDRYFRWVSRNRDSEAILRYLGDAEHIYRWQERYASAIRETAWRFNVPLADLRCAFLEARDMTSLMCADGIHPNAAGQALMASAVMSELGELRRQLSA